MDFWNLIAGIPGIGPFLPYLGALGLCCAAIATILPPPGKPNGLYGSVYNIVNWIGLNLGHARNATTKESSI